MKQSDHIFFKHKKFLKKILQSLKIFFSIKIFSKKKNVLKKENNFNQKNFLKNKKISNFFKKNKILFLLIKRRSLLIAFVTLCFLIFLTRGFSLDSINKNLKPEVKKTIVGKVFQIKTDKKKEKFSLYIESAKKKYLINVYENLSLKKEAFLFNKIVRVSAKFSLPQSRRNPNMFNYRLYLKTKGVDYLATVNFNDIKVFGFRSNLDFFFSQIYTYKLNFLNLCRQNLSEKNFSVFKALLFSDKSEIDDETYNSFRFNGLLHLLTTSGLHIGIIYLFILFIFRNNKTNKVLVITFFILFLYAFLVGFTIPILRAIIMIALHIFGRIIKRTYDLTSAAAFSGIVLLLANPITLFSASFILSYLAIFIVSFLLDFLKRFDLSTFVKNIILVFCIPLLMTPITIYIFNYFSLTTFIVSPIASFISEYILSLGIFLLIAFFIFTLPLFLFAYSFCLQLLTQFFSLFHLQFNFQFYFDSFLKFLLRLIFKLINLLLDIVNDIVQFFSNLPFSHFDSVSPNIFFLVLFYLLVFFLLSETFFSLFALKKRREIFICCIFIFFVTFAFGINNYFSQNDRPITFLDVGQGDCMILRTKNNKVLMFDSGGKEDYNLGMNLLKPYLLKNGISKVDAIFVSHEHTDHYKGALELKEKFPVEKIITPRNFKGDIAMDFSIEEGVTVTAFTPKKLNYEEVDSRGDKEFSSDSETIKANSDIKNSQSTSENSNPLTSQNLTSENENEHTVLYLINYFGTKILMTGDIDKEGEQSFLEKYDLNCDILKIAHHGSKYSTCKNFLRATSPKVAIIQVGKNTYGHPTPEVLNILRKYKIPIRRNDLEGAIIF